VFDDPPRPAAGLRAAEESPGVLGGVIASGPEPEACRSAIEGDVEAHRTLARTMKEWSVLDLPGHGTVEFISPWRGDDLVVAHPAC